MKIKNIFRVVRIKESWTYDPTLKKKVQDEQSMKEQRRTDEKGRGDQEHGHSQKIKEE